MILPIKSRLGKKLVEYQKNHRYFDEILENVDISTKDQAFMDGIIKKKSIV